MTLDSSSILQIDATIITGILILLTVSSFAQTDGTTLSDNDIIINKFKNLAIIVIILPFATSAVLTLHGRYRQVFRFEETKSEIQDTFFQKSQKLNDELAELQQIRNELIAEKGQEMPNYGTRKEENRRLIDEKHEEIKRNQNEHQNNKSTLYSDIGLDHPSRISIATMIVGFGLMVSLISALSILTFLA